jgi:hypothetical protein
VHLASAESRAHKAGYRSHSHCEAASHVTCAACTAAIHSFKLLSLDSKLLSLDSKSQPKTESAYQITPLYHKTMPQSQSDFEVAHTLHHQHCKLALPSLKLGTTPTHCVWQAHSVSQHTTTWQVYASHCMGTGHPPSQCLNTAHTTGWQPVHHVNSSIKLMLRLSKLHWQPLLTKQHALSTYHTTASLSLPLRSLC